MRLSHSLFKTERIASSDTQLVSQQLLLRTGLIRQISTGIYSLTPLAMRAINRISQIAKEEMSRVGGQEVLLPVTQPATLWEQSGRYDKIDSSLARWKDRNGQNMVLAMTHEEAVTDLVRHFAQSYRQLPIMLYQVQMKFRDEPRPRGGLVRLREFLMKDAYSFHADEQSLDHFYDQMLEAYEKFYQRCGVKVLRVQADTGMMGGGVSHEFMTLSDGGEDTLIICKNCGYASNREVATSVKVKNSLNNTPWWTFYMGSDDKPIAVGTLKGREVNLVLVARILGITEVKEASSEEDVQFRFLYEAWIDTNPSDMKEANIHVILDAAFSNEEKKRYKPHHMVDVSAAQAGDLCVNCGDTLEAARGIEVGNVFKLGTYYSAPMRATFTEKDGSSKPFIMGCYGIGITRMLACIIEDNHDEFGMIWPESVAPYRHHLLTIGSEEEVLLAAEKIYRNLGPEQVLYDDRDTTAGVKFTDADLLGLPYRLTVSKKSLSKGCVEIKQRRTGETTLIDIEKFLSHNQ